MKSKDRSLNFILISSVMLLVLLSVSNYYCSSFLIIDEVSYLVASIFNSLAIVAVPLIFMVSGAILIDKTFDLKKYYRNILNIIIIILIWTILYSIWNYLYIGTDSNIWLLPIEGLYKPVKDHLGLLYIFFGLYLILPFIQVLVKNMNYELENLFLKLWLFFTGTVYLITVILKLSSIEANIIYNIPLFQGAQYLGYFIVGYIIYKNMREKGHFPDYNKYFGVCYLLGTVITIVGTYAISINQNKYCDQLFSSESLFVIMSSISLFILVINNQKQLFKSNKFSRLIRRMAPYSLGIYLIHMFFVDVIVKIELATLLESYIAVPICFIAIYLLSLLIVFLIKKIPLIKKGF